MPHVQHRAYVFCDKGYCEFKTVSPFASANSERENEPRMICEDLKKKYRNILILESRDWWENWRGQFDPARDLVLTYDLGLRRDVEGLGGQAFYIDHLVSQPIMQENNFLAYQFFRDWHLDREGKDIFSYRGVPFGFSFRLEIWNDFIFYIRNRICLDRLRELQFEKVFAGTRFGVVENILKEMNIHFSPVFPGAKGSRRTYFFPIHRWMDERIRHRSLKHRFRDLVTASQGFVMASVDRALGWHEKPTVFIQEYYPTRDLLQRLKEDARVRLVLAHFSWATGWLKYLAERPIPVWGRVEKFQGEADSLMKGFRERHCARLILTGNLDVTTNVYEIIEERISSRMAESLRALDCVIRYLDKSSVKLTVLIANIGQIATLADCVSRARGIPRYLIINGWMSGDFLDESKYATVINSYSSSIREHYYRGMDNIVCLGDPRMDFYVRGHQPRLINRDSPTVTIGTSAHSIIDLNSYLAVEFDFMYDVLSALRIVKEQGVNLRIVIKVRSNGYREQYQKFSNEFFPGVVDEIFDTVPISSVLARTDFYISLYSQTLFEASCLGIPCLYYKNDREILDPPFDGKSELVTVDSVDALVKAFTDFRSGHERFDPFLEKSVMERYIGPLDGLNVERNLAFIYDLLWKDQKEIVS